VYSASLSPPRLVRLGPSKSLVAAHEQYTSTSLKRCHGLCGRSRDEGGFVRGSKEFLIENDVPRKPDSKKPSGSVGLIKAKKSNRAKIR
jgi:hypothetical protein